MQLLVCKCARLEQRKVGTDVQAVMESPEWQGGGDSKSSPAMLTASATLIRAINAEKVFAYLNPLSSSMPFVPFEFTSSFFNPFESNGDEFSLSSLP